MPFSRSHVFTASWSGVFLLLISLLSLTRHALAQDTQCIEPTGDSASSDSSQTTCLSDDRRPALYTQNFGDCLGNSLINVTRFDAAYYQDNMTVLFHLEGNSALVNESVMSMLLPNLKPRVVLMASSVHWRLCLWREPIRSDLQSMQCQYMEVCFNPICINIY